MPCQAWPVVVTELVTEVPSELTEVPSTFAQMGEGQGVAGQGVVQSHPGRSGKLLALLSRRKWRRWGTSPTCSPAVST